MHAWGQRGGREYTLFVQDIQTMTFTLYHLFHQIASYFPVSILQKTPHVLEEIIGQSWHDGEQELHELLRNVSSSGPA